VPVTTKLLAAGKTVLLEKPISLDLQEAESLALLVRPESANLMLGHIVLFNSEYLALRDEVQRRGPICYIDSVRHRPAADLVKHAGENPLQLAMVHDLYVVQALLDRREPVGFSAQMHRNTQGHVDLALAQLRWDDGTLATFAASFLTPEGMAPRGFDRMEVFGEGWAARLLSNPRPIEVWDERANWPMPLEIRADRGGPTGMMAEELRCFCRVARGLQQVPAGATFADALQVQRWMDRLEGVES
jgi:predicted dehydrogenase